MTAAWSWPGPSTMSLVTDLYQLTMLRSYYEEGLLGEAAFSLFARRLPPGRNYLPACGPESALRVLEELRFTDEALAGLAGLGLFPEAFLRRLEGLRFTGDAHAVAEGTAVFADEPLLEVVAPVLEAQLAETLLLNQVHFQTVAASKVARVVAAARGRTVVDFGLRRMYGVEAARGVRVFASGGLDEHEVDRLVAEGAPIDGFGVGTAMGVSADAPALDMAYKLVAYDGRGRVKLSPGKALLPGRKQVFRVERDGVAQHDLLGVAKEAAPGRPLLRSVMRKGRRTPEGRVTLTEARANAMRELALLPPALRGLGPAAAPYVVCTTDALLEARDRVIREVAAAALHAQERSP